MVEARSRDDIKYWGTEIAPEALRRPRPSARQTASGSRSCARRSKEIGAHGDRACGLTPEVRGDPRRLRPDAATAGSCADLLSHPEKRARRHRRLPQAAGLHAVDAAQRGGAVQGRAGAGRRLRAAIKLHLLPGDELADGARQAGAALADLRPARTWTSCPVRPRRQPDRPSGLLDAIQATLTSTLPGRAAGPLFPPLDGHRLPLLPRPGRAVLRLLAVPHHEHRHAPGGRRQRALRAAGFVDGVDLYTERSAVWSPDT